MGGGTAAQAALEAPEKTDGYPEPTMFGDTPAYGFFIRHAKGLRIDQVSLSYLKDDLRPAFVLDDVNDVTLWRVKAQSAGPATFVLQNVQDFGLHDSYPIPDKRIESIKVERF
jgi:hypothetical protein